MAVSLVISTAVYIYFESFACGVASFLGGVFIDIDHVLDGYLNYGRRFKLRKLFSYCRGIRFKRLSLIFHSYEPLALFWVLIFIFSLGDIWKAVAIGITQHVIFDQVRNVSLCKMDWRGYFFLFRLKNRFIKKLIYKR